MNYTLQRWATARWDCQRWADGGSGRAKAAAEGPWDDYIGDLSLSPSGAPTAEALGFSGWSTANYATGPLGPVAAAGSRFTVGVRLQLVGAAAGDRYAIGHTTGGHGIQLWQPAGTFDLECEVTNSTGGVVVNNRRVAMSGWSTSDVWAFIVTTIAFGGGGLHVVEVGQRSVRTATHTTAEAPDHQAVAHAIGRDLKLGSPFGGTVKEILSWATDLSTSQMADVADGTDRHKPITGYFQ